MDIRPHTLDDLAPTVVAAALAKCGGIHIQNALPVSLVEYAMDEFRAIFDNDELLARFPYDPEARLGYTPPGVEGLQKVEGANFLRSLFDYHPTLGIDSEPLRYFYGAVRDLGLDVLRRIDEACNGHASNATSEEAPHILRAADYLPEETTADDVLFPKHRDFGFLTVFVGTDCPGLQGRVKGVWHDIALPYGDVFIGVGTPLVQYHPMLKSFVHRVVGGGGRRLSAFLFIEPDHDTILPLGERYDVLLTRILSDVRKK